MSFSLPEHWVWDFWIVSDDSQYHLFYLHAPMSLGDPALRHRNAAVGHAVSTDLTNWTDHGVVLEHGAGDAFDATATWTGCVLRGSDGLWRMFYTGARFLNETANTNVESVGVAVSRDLFTWEKLPGPVLTSDPRWYERLADGTWREEAWRDPWVFADPQGLGWHMLVTARAANTGDDDSGVIGHATSPDLSHWTAQPPLSAPGAGFIHLEVPQAVTVEGRPAIVFSCDTAHLAGKRRAGGTAGGIWAVEADPLRPLIPIAEARLVCDDRLYAGRVVADPQGAGVLLAFEYGGGDDEFTGRICDPLPLSWTEDGALVAAQDARAERR